MEIVLDIETDSLDPKRVWVVVTKDVETDETRIFREPDIDRREREKLREYLTQSQRVIGHHIIKFDWAKVIRRLFKEFDFDPTKLLDTYVCSRLINYSVAGGHSLEAWGNRLKHPKVFIDDFTKGPSEEIVNRCVEDVNINTKLYKFFKPHIFSNVYKKAVELEHKIEFITLDIEEKGFYFDYEEALKIRNEINESLSVIDKRIMETFPPKISLIKEINPRLTKKGLLSLVDFKWLGEPYDLTPYSADAPFSLIEFIPFNERSPKQIVERLNEAGWKPLNKTKGFIEAERNLRMERDPQVRKELSEKIEKYKEFGWKVDETNLDTLPDEAPEGARLLAQRILLASRESTLTEWINSYDESDHRIHGKFMSIGAWSHRMSHQKPNMANIPSDPDIVDKDNPTPVEKWKLKYSKSLRALWGVPKKRRLVGVDADQIQLRVFAHYVNNADYIEALVNGDKEKGTDFHSLNAKFLDRSRNQAKTFIYSFLLGAGIDKTASILHTNTIEAREKVSHFIEVNPGLKELQKTIIPRDGRRGFFEGLDGRYVPVPSERHVLAGYLQNGEQLIMKVACVDWRQKLRLDKIDFKLVNFVHDEWQTECDDDDDIAKHIINVQSQAITDAGITLGLRCPTLGQGSFYNGKPGGYNWSQTH